MGMFSPSASRPQDSRSGPLSGPLSAPSAPCLLFFSGGTALRETARELAAYAPGCVHLVTPFDSGGSSAVLRQAFAMPAVGDARSRIVALADPERSEVRTLLAYRLSAEEPHEVLAAEMLELVRGDHPLMRQIRPSLQHLLREYLTWFILHMPPGFPLAGASLGNLVLTSGYLRHDRRLGPALELVSDLLRARGRVLPIVEDTAHLAVRLLSGEVLVGQHRFTGKAGPPPDSPIRDIWLTGSLDSAAPTRIILSKAVAALISNAGCICYPMGSFYSSVVANLLPVGVGRAVAANPGRKVFVPNLGQDPELGGHPLALQIERLLRPMLADAPGAHPTDLLSLILVDRDHSRYPGGIPYSLLQKLGMELCSLPLVAPDKGPLADPRLLAQALLTVAGKAGA